MTEQITLYTAKICPWAHRVELALEEAGIPYDRFEVNLRDKPEWYAPKVNPASKVPAISFGGPKVSPDQPSPESQKIAESYVLLEFIADLTNSLLPKDPIQRAKARFFIETATSKFVPSFNGAVIRGESVENVLKGAEAVQALLPAEGFAVGEWSIADAAITSFLTRAELALKNDLGAYDEGTGRKAYETIQNDPKFARFRKYLEDVKTRDSFKKTFDEEYLTKEYETRYPPLRAQRAVSAKA